MIEPHGGRLVHRIPENGADESLLDSLDPITIEVDQAAYQDVINIASGRYSPLDGFMTQNDYLKVVEDMTLEDGTVWTLPITIDIDAATAEQIAPGYRVGLEGPDGTTIGFIDVEEVYTYNKERSAKQIFGTSDDSHPGVAKLYGKDDFLVGGDIMLFELLYYHDSDLHPRETRVLFEQLGWETVAGFQTRNAPHRAHEYIQKSTLETVDGLLVQPKLGEKKVDDYTDEVIIEAYRTLIDSYYPSGTISLSAFPSTMRYAGPREAVFDAIIRKNHGCTHFIVGRDHAGVGDYYDELAAQQIFKDLPDIGISLLFYDYAFYCKRCDGMASEKTCPHGDSDRIHPSGSHIRKLIESKSKPSGKLMRPEVSKLVMNAEEPFVQDSNGTDQ